MNFKPQPTLNPTVCNIICWFPRPMGQTTRRPSIHLMFQLSSLFHKILQNSLQKPLQFFFYKITKIKLKCFECPKSMNYERKKILGTSDTWWMSHLSKSSQQTNVLYCRLPDFLSLTTYHPCVHLAPLLINNVASSLYHNAYHTTSMAWPISCRVFWLMEFQVPNSNELQP